MLGALLGKTLVMLHSFGAENPREGIGLMTASQG